MVISQPPGTLVITVSIMAYFKPITVIYFEVSCVVRPSAVVIKLDDAKARSIREM